MDLPFIRIGGRLISTDGAEGKELMKWETHSTYRHQQPFPEMLYRPRRCRDGIVRFAENDADGYDQGSCLTVNSEAERQKAMESGWRTTPQDALAAFNAKEDAIAEAAAHRHHSDQHMSESAKAEAKAADEATPEQVPEVPRKRAYRRKSTEAA